MCTRAFHGIAVRSGRTLTTLAWLFRARRAWSRRLECSVSHLVNNRTRQNQVPVVPLVQVSEVDKIQFFKGVLTFYIGYFKNIFGKIQILLQCIDSLPGVQCMIFLLLRVIIIQCLNEP